MQQDVGALVRAERQRRHVQAEVADERLLGTERQPPHRRVQTVGADHEVEPASGGALEGDVDAAVVLREPRDGVVPDELGVVADGVEQHRGQVAAR
ncbi:hypothetical protein Ais01nite_75900 [Asanoa ishikariensis]|nr:hypothetical protein [Asanoa ishikariensis]GIF69555.1 hypothetical protein Ais01nite_75900 [Asanoa ishikariensis]